MGTLGKLRDFKGASRCRAVSGGLLSIANSNFLVACVCSCAHGYDGGGAGAAAARAGAEAADGSGRGGGRGGRGAQGGWAASRRGMSQAG